MRFSASFHCESWLFGCPAVVLLSFVRAVRVLGFSSLVGLKGEDMKRLLCALCVTCALASGALFVGCSSNAGASSPAADPSSASAAVSTEPSSSSNAAPAEQSAASSEAADAASASGQATIADGEYQVPVATDSSMFHLNETSEGMGTLTVKDGAMNVHITLVSKKITNLYAGKAAQAETDEAGWLQPTEDTVTYSDGATEEVYGFDIPVPTLDEPFDVAILGSKGKWYDHTVTVTSPVSK